MVTQSMSNADNPNERWSNVKHESSRYCRKLCPPPPPPNKKMTILKVTIKEIKSIRELYRGINELRGHQL